MVDTGHSTFIKIQRIYRVNPSIIFDFGLCRMLCHMSMLTYVICQCCIIDDKKCTILVRVADFGIGWVCGEGVCENYVLFP